MSMPNESMDVLALFRAQQEHARSLQERLSREQAHVAELLSPFTRPPDAAAVFDVDERGLLVGVRIERYVDASADDVRRAFADAAAASRIAHPLLPVEAIDVLLDATPGAPDNVETVWDDLHQVGVSAQFGDVVGVDGADYWLARAPLEVIADEVLRIGLQAVHLSDRFGRFDSREGKIHG